MSDWISVEDRLPENRQHVLVSNGGKLLTSFYRSEENAFLDYKGWSLLAVTHWQPLPEPPV